MASNIIKFNGASTELQGVKWNGSIWEDCKGIKLNGEIVCEFQATEPETLASYKENYNAYWIALQGPGDSDEIKDKMATFVAENEFIVGYTRWVTYYNSELLYPGSLSDISEMFTITPEGIIQIDDQEKGGQYLNYYRDTGTLPSICSIYNSYRIYKHLTGLPLMFKTFNGFKGTQITTTSEDGEVFASQDSSGNWAITINVELPIDHNGEMMEQQQIVDAFAEYGISVDVNSDVVSFQDTSGYTEEDFYNMLCDVYISDFGPFYLRADYDNYYELEPNHNWDISKCNHWWVDLSNIDKNLNLYKTSTDGCGIYIDTIKRSSESDSGYEEYYPDEIFLNLLYYDISSFAGTKYPNVLCGLSQIYNYESYRDLENSIIGFQLTSDQYLPFPVDCNLTISPTQPTVYGSAWISANGFQNDRVEVRFTQNPTYSDADIRDYYSGKVPSDIADQVQDLVQHLAEGIDTYFIPSNNPSNPSRGHTYQITLRWRMLSWNPNAGGIFYPHVDSYDPQNVYGCYPYATPTKITLQNQYITLVQ